MIEGTITIREAEPSDVRHMREIYNHEVVHSIASWAWKPLSPDDWMKWVVDHTSGDHTIIVAEVDSMIAGFAGYGTFRPRAGYATTVEDSVYLREEYRGLGLGKALLKRLIESAKIGGFHAMIAAVTSENVASVGLHESVGFIEVGRLPQVGHKFGRWLDLTLLEMVLDHRTVPGTG